MRARGKGIILHPSADKFWSEINNPMKRTELIDLICGLDENSSDEDTLVFHVFTCERAAMVNRSILKRVAKQIALALPGL
mmetsp:Transcript_14782/g.17104  ORF Transcript_14782/g.17104 Transcript_14782/m.17104 type:complete len:80 (+) Transcript_14782:325-564(+)